MNLKKLSLASIALLSILVSSCTMNNNGGGGGGGGGGNDDPPPCEGDGCDPTPETLPGPYNPLDIKENEKPALASSDDYLDFFDLSKNVEISIDVSTEALSFIDKYQIKDSGYEGKYDALYFPCDVTFAIGTKTFEYEKTGIRMRGNLSRDSFFENGHFRSEDIEFHFKLSFQETFDEDLYHEINGEVFMEDWTDRAEEKEIRKDRTFLDMEKLDFKWNRNFDSTRARQAYAFHLFQDADVMTQNENIVKLNVMTENETQDAYYEVLEPIDKLFIQRRFPKDASKGDLYKCTYNSMGQADLSSNSISGNKIGVEDEYTLYHPIYDLKTNKKKSDHSLLKNLVNTFNDNHDAAATFKDTFESLVDVDNYLAFEAITYIAGNPDSHRDNSNNYYVYFESEKNLAYFIPYDFDRCFGILNNWEIDMSGAYPLSTRKYGQSSGGKSWQTNPILYRALLNETDGSVKYSDNWARIDSYKDSFKSIVLDYINNKGVLSQSTFADFVNSIYNKGNVNGGDNDNQSFEEYATSKKAVATNPDNYK